MTMPDIFVPVNDVVNCPALGILVFENSPELGRLELLSTHFHLPAIAPPFGCATWRRSALRPHHPEELRTGQRQVGGERVIRSRGQEVVPESGPAGQIR